MRKNKLKIRLIENNENNNNIDSKNKKLNLNINYAKLKFNKNILIQILKKTSLKKFISKKKKSQSNPSKINNRNDIKIPIKINNFNRISKTLGDYSKTVPKINKDFKMIPGIEKFHNITLEKINDLISTSNDTFREHKNTEKLIQSLKIDSIKKATIENIKNNYININDINISKENILPYLNKKSNRYNNTYINTFGNDINKQKRCLSLRKSDKNDVNEEIFYSKKISKSKISNNYITNKWLKSIQDSIKKYDILHRRSRVDRLIFGIENPEGCFEENLLDDKPGDKYIMLKTQMKNHKNKFEDIIREIKLNQKKSEYLMKKYIYDLISRKKKGY